MAGGIEDPLLRKPCQCIPVRGKPVPLAKRESVPFKSPPPQVLNGSLDVLRFAPRNIEILRSIPHYSAGAPCPLPRDSESRRMSEMQPSGWCGRDATAINCTFIGDTPLPPAAIFVLVTIASCLIMPVFSIANHEWTRMPSDIQKPLEGILVGSWLAAFPLDGNQAIISKNYGRYR